jgi:tetratricopeptide (TPR) repeat protein
MAQHVFVAMPFGVKEGIDFNRVYAHLIKPALQDAGFDVFRADEELRAGNIRTDMFQELLLADLVVVDLSIDNPNVWYELGVRHALRVRGVIQIQAGRDYMPFDLYTDRTLRYHIKEGVPDPEFIDDEREALGLFATETMASWHGRKISPVYHHLTYLQEPDWKSLRVDSAKEFWEIYEAWAHRIELARLKGRPGDILVLAEEAPSLAFRLEAYRAAGNALRSLGQFKLALEQFEKALTIAPKDLESRRQKGILLGRCGKYDQARVWLEALVKDHPGDAESWGLLGRVNKDAWMNAWRRGECNIEKMRAEATHEEALLRETINAYAEGFRRDPGNYYPGINALTLSYLHEHLTGEKENAEERQAMEGGIRWAVQSALTRFRRDYWARVTLGDLKVLVSDKKAVERAYNEAVAVAERDWFALNSSRDQLILLRDLGFRTEEVEEAIGIFDRALEKGKAPEERWEPSAVFLFSGHMIDAPGRKPPRFPDGKEPVDAKEIAAKEIAAKLDDLGAGEQDLALCGGACGGDLLFAEACLKRNLRLEVRIPFEEPTFLRESVTFAGDEWLKRFYDVKANPNTTLLVMPEELGPTHRAANPYARNNLWQLYSALSRGPDKVRFICLWNRQGGDGPGGTEDMHNEVLKHSGHVYVLDTNVLW